MCQSLFKIAEILHVILNHTKTLGPRPTYGVRHTVLMLTLKKEHVPVDGTVQRRGDEAVWLAPLRQAGEEQPAEADAEAVGVSEGPK